MASGESEIIDTIYNGDDDALYNENSDDGIDYDRQERKKFTINMITCIYTYVLAIISSKDGRRVQLH